jgi:hypothetical protein
MPLIAYLDETGDHSLELVDKDFPIFALVLLVCDTTTYIQRLVPAVYQLKMDYFRHEGVILHSRDIRKAQGDFLFLRDATKRQPFYDRINGIMGEDYQLIACVIHKQHHKNRYGAAANDPYDLALKFVLERLLPLLEDEEQDEIWIVAEARGGREDGRLLLAFNRVVSKGTKFISAERFQRKRFQLVFKPKMMNIVGTQLADLAAYPIARFALDPNKPNPAYDVVEKRFYRRLGALYGLKVFP